MKTYHSIVGQQFYLCPTYLFSR